MVRQLWQAGVGCAATILNNGTSLWQMLSMLSMRSCPTMEAAPG